MERLRELRLDAHLTQKSLADMSGRYGDHITRHAVLRMEQHVYPTPLPSVIGALSEITGFTEESLIAQYLREVTHNRLVNGELWGLKSIRSSIFDHDYGSLHSFRGFRTEIAHISNNPESAIQFCMAFSIHPYTLAEYENSKTTYPHQIRLALTEGGLPDNINAILSTEERFNRIQDRIQDRIQA